MRRIDYWVGIPLCFFLSSVLKLKSIFKKKDYAPKRILFIQLSEMGSLVHSYAAINHVRKIYPESTFYFLIFKDLQEFIHILNIIPKDKALTIRRTSFLSFLKDTFLVLHKIRRKRIDTIIDFELFSRFTAIINGLSGAQRRVGFHSFNSNGLYRGNFLTHKVAYNPYSHISQNFMALIYALESKKEKPLLKRKISIDEIKIPRIMPGPGLKNKVMNKFNLNINKNDKIVIINPNSSKHLPQRRWPLCNYIELAKRLLENKNICILITGNIHERGDADKICMAISDKKCISLAGKTNLYDLIDLYNISDLLVSNDSGPPNFASLTNIKVIVLFGPETPILYAPLGPNVKVMYHKLACSPCVSVFNQRKSVCKDNRCLKLITVEEVYKTARKSLGI